MTGKGHSLLKQPLFAAVTMGCTTAWRSIRVLAKDSLATVFDGAIWSLAFE